MNRLIEAHYDPEEYDYVPVVVFRSHERIKNGKHIKVGKGELEDISKKHNDLWEKYARASPLSFGHTLDSGPHGANVPEKEQPDLAGDVVRFHVEPAPDEPDEWFLHATWCRPKAMKSELSKYKALSPEYLPSKSWLYPISLLKASPPELPDMPPPPTKYELDVGVGDEAPYRIVVPNPFRYSNPKETPMNPDEFETKPVEDVKVEEKKEDKKPEDKAKDEAKDKEKKGSKQDASDLSEIKEMLAQLMPLVQIAPQLMKLAALVEDEEGEGKDDDLMKPDDKPVEDKPAPKDDKPVDDVKVDPPVKFEGTAMGSATNGYVPSDTKKEKYAMQNDELVKYKAEIDAKLKAKDEELATVKKLAEDLNKKDRLAEAEKLVYRLENEFGLQMSDKVKAEDAATMAAMPPKAALQYFERAKERYPKKLPNSAAAEKVSKYAAEGADDVKQLSPADAKSLADKIVNSGMSYDEYLLSLAKK